MSTLKRGQVLPDRPYRLTLAATRPGLRAPAAPLTLAEFPRPHGTRRPLVPNHHRLHTPSHQADGLPLSLAEDTVSCISGFRVSIFRFTRVTGRAGSRRESARNPSGSAGRCPVGLVYTWWPAGLRGSWSSARAAGRRRPCWPVHLVDTLLQLCAIAAAHLVDVQLSQIRCLRLCPVCVLDLAAIASARVVPGRPAARGLARAAAAAPGRRLPTGDWQVVPERIRRPAMTRARCAIPAIPPRLRAPPGPSWPGPVHPCGPPMGVMPPLSEAPPASDALLSLPGLMHRRQHVGNGSGAASSFFPGVCM